MLNLLEETKHLIREGRVVGNTTRQVDTAIDLLHQSHEILVVDHSNTSSGMHHLLHKINKRLEFMYNHLFGTKIKLRHYIIDSIVVIKLKIDT
jgi:hypothetical protein